MVQHGRNPLKDEYMVVNTQTGKVHAKHSTKANAEAQVRLLYGLEKGGMKLRPMK
jgi:hypothetical protein